MKKHVPSLIAMLLLLTSPGVASVPPFAEDFSTEAGFNRFTVINANQDTSLGVDADGNTIEIPVSWFFDYSRLCASYEYNKADLSIGADDWLITPGLELESGRTYTLTFRVGCANSQGERIEVKMGDSPSVEGMTDCILEPTDVTEKLNFSTSMGRVYTFPRVSVAQSGTYYFGFHAISPPNHFRLMLDDISITANPSDEAPGIITDLKAIAAPQGGMSATVSFTAPTTAVNGSSLSAISNIRLTRGETLIHTFDHPMPGSQLSFVDESAPRGNNLYHVVASNSAGSGDPAETMVYVGIDVPQRPLGSVAADSQDHVSLSWNAVPTTGLNGGYVDPADVAYTIYSMEGGYVVKPLATTLPGVTTANIDMDTETGEQQLCQFAIQAANATGKSEYGMAALVTGHSYRLPFIESFAFGQLQNYWYRAAMGAYEPAFDLSSSDGDQSSYQITMQAGTQVRFISGKISMRGAVNPTLLFHHLAIPGSECSLAVEIQKPDGSIEALKTIDYSQLSGSAQWTGEQISLRNYLNERYVQVVFHFVSEAPEQAVNIDDVRVVDLLEYDLAASLNTPSQLSKGVPTEVSVTISNLGSETADDYRVRLFADDKELLNEYIADALAPYESRTFAALLSVSPMTIEEQVLVRAVVEFDYDLDENNNEATSTVSIMKSGLPTATGLQGWQTDEGIVITWHQPESLSRVYTETFEGSDFPAWSNGGITADISEGMLGDWRVIDADRQETFRLTSQQLYESEGGCNAWTVLQPGLVINLDNNPRIRPHSGDRYLMALGAATGPSDDWLISPALSGEAQQISFWASEYSAAFEPEKYEVYYSTTGADIADMTLLGEGTLTEERWTELTFDLPVGTRHFAIRHTSDNSWGMMVDDVTYGLSCGEVKAYNIYRGEQLIGSVDSQDELRYVDTEATEQQDTYYVTVVYSDGAESDAVAIRIELLGISSQTYDSAERTSTLYTLQGQRTDGAKRKGIYVSQGKKRVIR
ncbi:MAG: choice-of-anchor J domain-containing protein [Prevotella sp.]|nr:choice-of-anchor J domain-containing protein [Prevotella sp.]